MPRYRLTYFQGRGRAEVARLVFAVAGVEYEDRRLTKEQWMPIKPSTQFGCLPFLEIDGKPLCQSNAICRYIAKLHGLNGADDFEAAQIDMVVDCIEDTLRPLFQVFYAKTDEEKANVVKLFLGEKLPVSMHNLECILKKNEGGDAFFVGEGLTWCDLAFFHAMEAPSDFGVDIPLDDYPKLKALKERIAEEPRVKEWLQKRP